MVKLCLSEYPIENEQKYKKYFEMFQFSLSSFQKYAIQAIVDYMSYRWW